VRRTPRSLPLERVQSWMQAVLLHPGTTSEALAAPAAAWIASADDVVLPSRTLRPSERVAIYHDMVAARFHNTLHHQFPALRSALGDDRFATLVSAYTTASPSHSYTLARLGDRLPLFLGRWDALPPREREALAELARFELAIDAVMDLPTVPAIGTEQLGRIPADLWAEAQLLLQPSLRLLRVSHGAADAHAELEAGRRVPAPRRRATHLAVFRLGQRVHTLVLSRHALRFLEALAAGRRLGEALATLPQATPRALERWLAEWVGEGLLAGVTLRA